MHQPIRESLEDFLRAGRDRQLPAKFQAHLGECTECAGELKLLQEQSQLLRALGSAAEVEPRAGFYARVIERIQAQPASIWSVFLERKFGFRLALASAALVALLATYLVTSEASGPEFIAQPSIAATDSGSAPAAPAASEPGSQQQERNAVLVDLASYHP